MGYRLQKQTPSDCKPLQMSKFPTVKAPARANSQPECRLRDLKCLADEVSVRVLCLDAG